MSENKEKLDKAKFFFKLASQTDKLTAQSYDRLSKKIYEILGIITATFSFVFGLGYFVLTQTPKPQFIYVFSGFIIGLIMFVFALVQGLFLLIPKKKQFKYVDPQQIFAKYKGKELSYIINKYSATWVDTITQNIAAINAYHSGLRRMLVFIFVGILSLIAVFCLLGITFFYA